MIAHRLETAVTYSDKIIVMDGGCMVEYAHSFELMIDNCGQYVHSKMIGGLPQSPTRDTIFSSMV